MRILLVNEASVYLSGLGKIGKVICETLTLSGHTVAELACGIGPEKQYSPGWKVYPGLPAANNTADQEKFKNDPYAQYGSWIFEQVVLDFKPDVVMAINDPHTMHFINFSPLKRYYTSVLMPTIDSLPLKPEWHSSLSCSDHLLFYSDWAAKNSQLKSSGVMRYPVSSVFQPMDKATARVLSGMPLDGFIYGTVCKNQPRKSVHDLFSIMSDVLGENDYLYLHMDYPGSKTPWNLVDLIQKYDLYNKVLLPYICVQCGHTDAKTYRGDVTMCGNCKKYSLYTRNVTLRFSDEKLNCALNSLDAYVQFAEAEGACVPIGEAAVCGIPVICPNATAMADYETTVDAVTLKSKYKYHQRWESFRLDLDIDDNIDIIKSVKDMTFNNLANKASMIYSQAAFAARLNNFFDNLQCVNKAWDSPLVERELITKNVNIEELNEILTELNFSSPYHLAEIYSLMVNNPLNLPPPVMGVNTKEFMQYLNNYINNTNLIERTRCKLNTTQK